MRTVSLAWMVLARSDAAQHRLGTIRRETSDKMWVSPTGWHRVENDATFEVKIIQSTKTRKVKEKKRILVFAAIRVSKVKCE